MPESPYVAARRAWERRNGSMNPDQSKAFGQDWDAWCTARRQKYAGRTVPELTAEEAETFGWRWTAPRAEEGQKT